jgi:hypothetical protein
MVAVVYPLTFTQLFFRTYTMGCVPSKKHILEEEGLAPQMNEKQLRKQEKERRKQEKKEAKARRPLSPVLEGEQPPWVTGHRKFAVGTDDSGAQLVVLKD